MALYQALGLALWLAMGQTCPSPEEQNFRRLKGFGPSGYKASFASVLGSQMLFG